MTTRWVRSVAVRAVAGVLVVLVAASGCSSRRAEQYRQEGETYLRLNKLDEATTAFTRAEEADPGNARAKTGLGRVHLAREEYTEAYAKFMEAAAIDPSIGEELENAVDAFIRAGRSEVQELVERFTATNPLGGGLLHAYFLRESGQTRESAAALETLAAEYPEDAEVKLSLVRSYLASGQADKAADTAEAALLIPGADPIEARMLLVEAFAAQGRLREAIEAFRKAVAANPGDTSAKVGLARALAESGDIAEARDVATSVLNTPAAAPWAQYVLGAVALAEDKPVEALTALQEALRALPRERAVQRKMAAAQRAARGGAPAPGDAPAEAPEAAPLVAGEQLPDWQTLWNQAALRRLVENRAAFLEQDTSTRLREVLLLASVFTQQAGIANELSTQLPQESPLKGYMSLVQDPKIDSVRTFFEAWPVGEGADDVVRSTALGHVLAMVGARAQAVYAFSQTYEQHPENSVGLYCIAQVYRAAQMPLFAARALERVVNNALDNSEAHTLLFVVLRQADREDDARLAAESAYSLFPRDRQIVLNLAQAYLDAGETLLAIRAIERGREHYPEDPALRVALAGVFLHEDRPVEARGILENLEGVEALVLEAKALTAFALAREGNWDGPAALLEDPAFRNAHPSTQRLALSALLRLGRGDDVRQVVEDMAAEDAAASAAASDAEVAYAQALQQRRLYRQAFEAYQALDKDMADVPWLVQGLFASLASAPAVADRVTVARDIAERHAGMEDAWLGLALVAHAARNTAVEDEALAKSVEVAPSSATAWQRRAEFLEREKRMADALGAYEALVALTPQSAAANNNLAYCMLMTGGDAKAALEYAQRARDVLPSHPGVLHTLGLAQMRTGDLEQARRNLGVALELMPANPTLLLDFGILTIRMGDEDAGKHYVQLALRYTDQLKLEFDRRAEAEGLLSGTPAAPEAA